MANYCHRRDGAGPQWSSCPAKAPHFFKIIFLDTVEGRRLAIPKAFMRKHGKNLSNLVSLKVPSGAVWQIQLNKANSRVFLQNGWQEFMEYYSIKFGHFLVFRYEGNSHFHVLIFDMSASEIEYPFSATHAGQVSPMGGCQLPKTEEIEILDYFPRCKRARVENIEAVEILNDFPTCQTARQARRVPYSQSRRIQTNGVKLEKTDADLDSHCLTKEIEKEHSEDMSPTPKHLQSEIRERKATAGALRRAKAFKSENPFFVVSMQPSYVSARFTLNIPLIFAKKYFKENHSNAVLRVSDGRTWSVKCSLGTANAKFCSGWKAFVEDNKLNLGDVCVFELEKGSRSKRFLNVIVFRTVEDAPNCCCRKRIKREIC